MYFGELVLETSRAFPDDDEENDDGAVPQYRIAFEASPHGNEFMKTLKPNSEDINLYIFDGKVARGFGDGFIKDDQFQSLGHVNLGGVDGTVDSLLQRPGQRRIIRLYKGPARIVFAFVDTYGVPRSLSNEIMRSISCFIDAANKVVIFNSQPIALYRGQRDVQGRAFYLKSSTVQLDGSSISKSFRNLPQPNIISGVSAGVLTECEVTGKKGILFATFCETELIDSISTKPFFDILQKAKDGTINLNAQFSQLTYNQSRSSKTNLNPLADSNLYT